MNLTRFHPEDKDKGRWHGHLQADCKTAFLIDPIEIQQQFQEF